MGKIVYLLIILIVSSSSTRAQENPPANPSNTPNNQTQQSSGSAATNRESARERLMRQQQANARLRYPESIGPTAVRTNKLFRAKTELLYRKPGMKELKALEPDQSDLQKYSELLKQPNTGMFKLIANADCNEDTNVLVATHDCQKYKIPGLGASYSFRIKNYRIHRLADLTLVANSLVAKGALVGAIFVNLGDVPLERAGLNTNGLRFLVEYRPSKTAKEAFQSAQILARGVKGEGFIYSRAIFLKENTTFALRSIAYRGNQMKAIDGVVYNELNFDKRRDVIVAFRIVRKYEDGSITILWKELRNKKSPKLSAER